MRLRVCIVLLLATPLTGCIGLEYSGTHEGSTTSPCIATTPGVLFEGAHQFVATMEQVGRDWGPPSQISFDANGTERWTYYGPLRWNGVLLLAVVIPLPLFIPMGRERVSIDFRDGTAVFGEAVASEEAWQVFLGLHLHDGWTAKAGSREWSRIPQVRVTRASG
jgi:hypothetical protein